MKQYVQDLVRMIQYRSDLWEPIGSGFQRVVQPYPETNGGIQCPSAKLVIQTRPTRVIANGIEQPLGFSDRRAIRRAVRAWYAIVRLGTIQGRIGPTLPMVTAIVAALALSLGSCTVTLPVAATAAPIGPHEGKATATQVLGAWVHGDASIQSAARAGGIRQVSTVDMRTTNVLGVYVRRTCIVTGEQ